MRKPGPLSPLFFLSPLCTFSSASPLSPLSSFFLLQEMYGAYTQWPVPQIQILCTLPKEVHMYAWQAAQADFGGPENHYTYVYPSYIYLFFPFLTPKRSSYPLVKPLEIKSMCIITKANLFPNTTYSFLAIITILILISNIYWESGPNLSASVAFHFIFPWIL